jgi:hypothetical protein
VCALCVLCVCSVCVGMHGPVLPSYPWRMHRTRVHLVQRELVWRLDGGCRGASGLRVGGRGARDIHHDFAADAGAAHRDSEPLAILHLVAAWPRQLVRLCTCDQTIMRYTYASRAPAHFPQAHVHKVHKMCGCDRSFARWAAPLPFIYSLPSECARQLATSHDPRSTIHDPRSTIHDPRSLSSTAFLIPFFCIFPPYFSHSSLSLRTPPPSLSLPFLCALFACLAVRPCVRLFVRFTLWAHSCSFQLIHITFVS